MDSHQLVEKISKTNLSIEEAKKLYREIYKLYKTTQIDSNTYTKIITENPVLKTICHPISKITIDSLNYTDEFNKCKTTHSTARCASFVGTRIATTMGMGLVSTTLVKSSITMPMPLNFVSFGTGLYLMEKTNEFSKGISNYVRDVNGVRLVNTQVKIMEQIQNARMNDNFECILKNGTKVKFPQVNIIYVKEILELFQRGINEFKLSFENPKFTSEGYELEFDVEYEPVEIAQTNFARIMYEADKVIKNLMNYRLPFSGKTPETRELDVDGIKFSFEDNRESINELDLMISQILPGFADVDRAFAAVFVLTDISYDIYEILDDTFLLFNNDDYGITIKIHSVGLDTDHDKIPPHPMKEELLTKRNLWLNEWQSFVEQKLQYLSKDYPELLELIDLAKALTIAKIMFQHKITFKHNLVPKLELSTRAIFKVTIDTFITRVYKENILYTQMSGGVVLQSETNDIFYDQYSDVIPDYKYGILKNIYSPCANKQEFDARVLDWRTNYPNYLTSDDERIVEFNEILKLNSWFKNEFFEHTVQNLWCFTTKRFISQTELIVDDEKLEELCSLVISSDNDLEPLMESNGIARLWYENYNTKYFTKLRQEINKIEK